MANVLPIFFVIAAGLCLSFVLLALWQSLRGVLLRGAGAAAGSAPGDRDRERLLHEKQELLTAIRDVRLEHQLGKVSDDDYARLEQNYRSRARDVLRELEEQIAPHRTAATQLLEQALGGRGAARSDTAVRSPATPREVASATQSAAAPREVASATQSAVAPREVASATQARAASREALDCGRCKASNDVDAVFCKKCGERLRAQERT